MTSSTSEKGFCYDSKFEVRSNQSESITASWYQWLRQDIGVHHQKWVSNHTSHEDAKAELHKLAGATSDRENSSNKGSDGVRASVSEGRRKQWQLEGVNKYTVRY